MMDPIYLHLLNALMFPCIIALLFVAAPAVNRFLGMDED